MPQSPVYLAFAFCLALAASPAAAANSTCDGATDTDHRIEACSAILEQEGLPLVTALTPTLIAPMPMRISTSVTRPPPITAVRLNLPGILVSPATYAPWPTAIEASSSTIQVNTAQRLTISIVPSNSGRMNQSITSTAARSFTFRATPAGLSPITEWRSSSIQTSATPISTGVSLMPGKATTTRPSLITPALSS